MYSFLFINSKNKLDNIITNTSNKILKYLLNYGYDLEVESCTYNQLNAGWFVIKPAKKMKNSLFHSFSQNKVHVLLYGNLVLPFNVNPADKLYNTWLNGGIEAARELNGCFSAIIIDNIKDEVITFSDIFGLRRLRYFNDDDTTIISTQDIPILATGLVPINYDLTSIYSISTLDWSLRGKSIIQGICSIHPT